MYIMMNLDDFAMGSDIQQTSNLDIIRIGCAGRWLAASQLVMELPRAQVRLGILGLDLSIGIAPSNCDNWLSIGFSIGFPSNCHYMQV